MIVSISGLNSTIHGPASYLDSASAADCPRFKTSCGIARATGPSCQIFNISAQTDDQAQSMKVTKTRTRYSSESQFVRTQISVRLRALTLFDRILRPSQRAEVASDLGCRINRYNSMRIMHLQSLDYKTSRLSRVMLGGHRSRHREMPR